MPSVCMHDDAMGCCTHDMQAKAEAQVKPNASVSVSIAAELYQTLEQLAKQKNVSVTSTVRAGAEKYIAEQRPLFTQGS
jgi:hypothetical protein